MICHNYGLKLFTAHSAGAIEYTNCISAEGFRPTQ